jgi:N utilization substance protein A
MPAIQRSEFALALNQVANERGIDPEIVLDTVKNAIVAAYRKDHPDIDPEEYSATLDPNSGEAKIFHKDEDVTPPGFGRIAAQTAKQVILQKIREKEKEAIITDYKVRMGTIVNGMVLRFAGPNIIIDIGKTEGIMPPEEQIPNEKYHLNQRLTVYLSEIKEGLKGEEIIVSRASNGLLEGLLRREVPEVAQGSVEIKQIVREPGNRAKIAVSSTQSGIDPVGSCVGQKGVRVQAVIGEFNGIEKIDIIQWTDSPKDYIVQALSPAKNLVVEIDEKEKTARVLVPGDELSLAIGKDGQNVRLASKLTGYRIEIEEDPNAPKTASNAADAVVKEEPKEEPQDSKEPTPEPAKEELTEEETPAELNLEAPATTAEVVAAAAQSDDDKPGTTVTTPEETVEETPTQTPNETVETPGEQPSTDDKIESQDEENQDQAQ